MIKKKRAKTIWNPEENNLKAIYNYYDPSVAYEYMFAAATTILNKKKNTEKTQTELHVLNLQQITNKMNLL